MAKKFRPFIEARKYVRTLKLKNYKKWLEYTTSGKKPADIPSNPWLMYKKFWYSLGDWLGTYYIAHQKRKFRSFFEARKYARALGLKSFTNWIDYCKSKKIPRDIPTTPSRTYKNNGWIGWGDWLGTGNIAPYNRKFISFSRARIYARSLGLQTSTEWFDYARYGNKPNFIPIDPSQTYKKEWISWFDWLGTNKKIDRKK